MPMPQTKYLDFTIGQGTHGKSECPHSIFGIFIVTAAFTEMCENLPAINMFTMTIHDCPHCPVGMAISSTPLKNIENLPGHRTGDVVVEFCGIGMTCAGAATHMVGP